MPSNLFCTLFHVVEHSKITFRENILAGIVTTQLQQKILKWFCGDVWQNSGGCIIVGTIRTLSREC